jgi:hypothetical protein
MIATRLVCDEPRRSSLDAIVGGDETMSMETILIVLVVLFLLGGGGWGYSRWRG